MVGDRIWHLIGLVVALKDDRHPRQTWARRKPGKGCERTSNETFIVTSQVRVSKWRFVARPFRGKGGRLRFLACIVLHYDLLLVGSRPFVDAN